MNLKNLLNFHLTKYDLMCFFFWFWLKCDLNVFWKCFVRFSQVNSVALSYYYCEGSTGTDLGEPLEFTSQRALLWHEPGVQTGFGLQPLDGSGDSDPGKHTHFDWRGSTHKSHITNNTEFYISFRFKFHPTMHCSPSLGLQIHRGWTPQDSLRY